MVALDRAHIFQVFRRVVRVKRCVGCEHFREDVFNEILLDRRSMKSNALDDSA
jgi:hypothetical protein